MKVNIGDYPETDDPRQVSVVIEKFDIWNMNDTLALIILPMLKMLKEDKHGVPGNMKSLAYDSQSSWPQECFAFYSEDDADAFSAAVLEWEEILDKIIWSFEQIGIDWESQYWEVAPEFDFDEYPEDEGKELIPLRWKTEGECDSAGLAAHGVRIQEGFDLFGKHYENFWS